MNCPDCGVSMNMRRNVKDGSYFYGCSNYPTCKRTVNIDMGPRSGRCWNGASAAKGRSIYKRSHN